MIFNCKSTSTCNLFILDDKKAKLCGRRRKLHVYPPVDLWQEPNKMVEQLSVTQYNTINIANLMALRSVSSSTDTAEVVMKAR